MAGLTSDFKPRCPHCGAPEGAPHGVWCTSENQREPEPAPKAVAKNTKMLRIVLVNGNFFDIPQPADFSVVQYISSVRACGYILNHMLYVPLEQIQSMFTYDGTEALPAAQGLLLAPSTDTKQ